MDSENSYGICIPDNSSYNEISNLLATGSLGSAASSNSSAGGLSHSSLLGLAIGVALGGLLVLGLLLGLAMLLVLRQRRGRQLPADNKSVLSSSDMNSIGGSMADREGQPRSELGVAASAPAGSPAIRGEGGADVLLVCAMPQGSPNRGLPHYCKGTPACCASVPLGSGCQHMGTTLPMICDSPPLRLRA